MGTNVAHVDLDALASDLDELQEELRAQVGPADVAHFRRLMILGRVLALVGLGTSWIVFNPISVLFLAVASFTRWAVVAHHIIHRGFEKVPGAPARWNAQRFARGWRRVIDWFDWMDPDAWHYEHDLLHHYNLGEKLDPDLPERNINFVRFRKFPMWFRTALVLYLSSGWKFWYYAPNTINEVCNREARKRGERRTHYLSRDVFLPLGTRYTMTLWRCWLPYSAWRFGVLPALFIPLGFWAWLNALLTLLAAELVTNLWSFWVIVPNHTGDDLYRFDRPTTSKGEFYLRQILGSTNYTTGSDLNDFLHGWLNYQIEHHLYPNMTPLQYQRAQPRVRAICEKHGVPYVQESVFTRMVKTMNVIIGRKRAIRWVSAPAEGA